MTVRRVMFWLALVLAVPAVIAGGLVAGAALRVQKTEPWNRVVAPDASWAAAFPSRPTVRRGPAPDPFKGEIETWSVSTDSATYEVAVLDPQPTKEPIDPMTLAAATANTLGGQLTVLDQKGSFSITLTNGSELVGRVIANTDGKLFRALASRNPHSTTEDGVRLFVSQFDVRASR